LVELTKIRLKHTKIVEIRLGFSGIVKGYKTTCYVLPLFNDMASKNKCSPYIYDHKPIIEIT